MSEAYRRRGSNRSVRKYHTDPECPVGKQIKNRAPVPDAHDLEQCKWCAGKVDMTGPQGPKLANVLEAMDV